MIVASINGTPALGFVEFVDRDDGTADRAGVLKLTAANAQRLQAMLERNEPLIYAGPVFLDGRWCSQTLSIAVRSMDGPLGQPSTVHIVEKKAEGAAAA